MKTVDLFKFASKDDCRAFLQGVFHDGGYKVATNGFIMAKVKADYPAESEGLLLDKAGKEIYSTDKIRGKYKAQFPNYRRVIPDLSQMHVIGFDFKQVTADIKSADALLKINQKVSGDLAFYTLSNGGFISDKMTRQIAYFCECFPDAALYAPVDEAKWYEAYALVHIGGGTLENPDALCVFMPCQAQYGCDFKKSGFSFVVRHYRDDVGKVLRAMNKYNTLRHIRENTLTAGDKKLLAAVQEYLALAFPRLKGKISA